MDFSKRTFVEYPTATETALRAEVRDLRQALADTRETCRLALDHCRRAHLYHDRGMYGPARNETGDAARLLETVTDG